MALCSGSKQKLLGKGNTLVTVLVKLRNCKVNKRNNKGKCNVPLFNGLILYIFEIYKSKKIV